MFYISYFNTCTLSTYSLSPKTLNFFIINQLCKKKTRPPVKKKKLRTPLIQAFSIHPSPFTDITFADIYKIIM